MSFVPYLHFQGNCAEAMQYYADCFGGGDLQIAKYADAPSDIFPDGQRPADDGRVMHASLTVDGATLMASDFPPGMPGDPQKAVSVAHAVPDVETGRALFNRLAEGGAVVLPFGETFWAEGFGMLKDRFGTHWMISGPGKVPAAG